MSTLATALLAAATTDGISPRIMMLLIGSTMAGLVGGVLGFIGRDGTHNQKLAAGVIAGFIVFVTAYSFLDGLVLAASPSTSTPTPSPRR